jgi:hypothetical protein
MSFRDILEPEATNSSKIGYTSSIYDAIDSLGFGKAIEPDEALVIGQDKSQNGRIQAGTEHDAKKERTRKEKKKKIRKKGWREGGKGNCV